MNNFLVSLKRFIKNKNTVTVLGVLVVIVALYVGYNMTVTNATKPIQIPIAKSTIQPRTQITPDMLDTISMPAISVKSNVKRLKSDILGKYTNVNVIIPAGSMFYNEALIAEKDLPNYAFTQVKDGQIPYAFPVTMETTYGNSILPGTRIDIYMKAENETNQVMVGKFLENVEVLAVKDSNGNNVFENTTANRTPATILFGVPEEIHILLRKASYMRGNGVVLFPVPHGGTVPSEGEIQVSTQYLKDFINANTVVLPEQGTTTPNPDNNQGTGA